MVMINNPSYYSNAPKENKAQSNKKGDTKDKNAPSNKQRTLSKKKGGYSKNKRVCSNCKSTRSYMQGKYEKWYRYKKGYLCKKCADKEYNQKHPEYIKKWREINPAKVKQYSKKWHAIINPKRLGFKDKRIVLKDNPRSKGICKICNKKVGDQYVNAKGKVAIVKMHVHHVDYIEDDPLMYTCLLCSSCHRRVHSILEKEKMRIPVMIQNKRL
jgi:hypothetical protein